MFLLGSEDLIAGNDDVVEAAVIGVSDPDWGQGLRAFVVLKPDAKLDESGVKAYVRAHLASYKVPRDVRFIDALPRNATGKVLKKELKR